MALITRLSRLMRADLNALLDRLEEPDILLAQALRDMQQTLADDARTLAAMTRERQQLRQRRETLSQRNTAASAELELCLDAEQDDLARALLRRGLEQERLDALLGQRERDLDSRIQALTETLSQRRQRLEALRAQASLFSNALEPNDEPAGSLADAALAPIQDADIEIALLAAKRRRAS
jgi:phage shock protein A